MKGILSFTLKQLTAQFVELGLAKFRVNQVLDWIYSKGVTSFTQMTNLNFQMQHLLNDNYYIYRPKISKINTSVDGTKKFLLLLNDGMTVETVFIPEDHRNTVCVSTQVGCAVGCKFCNTGYNGFKRNLRAEEIVSQVLIIKDYLNSWAVPSNKISNIVLMGMGEPLYNWPNVSVALENFKLGNEKQRINIKHITLSTSGIVPVLTQIIPTLECNLAISLHAPNAKLRSSIMPINDLYHLESLLLVCRNYNALHPNRLITFEYLMLNGVNDSSIMAKQLVKLLHGIKCKVNLIRFNSWKGDKYQGCSEEKVQNFRHILVQSGINATIRNSRGQDIMAACGQLQSHK